MDQSLITRYVSRFEPLLYVTAFTQKDFHYIVYTGLPTQGPPLMIWVIQIESTQLLSPTIQPLHKRQGTIQITSTLRGKGTQPKQRKGFTIFGDLKDHKPILSHKTKILIVKIDR